MAESIEELIAEREKLLTDKHTNAEILSSCRAQIDAAKATAHVDNQYSDPKWFAKVTSRAVTLAWRISVFRNDWQN